MAYVPFTNLPQQFFDNLGNPLVSGTLYAYLAGTSTPTNMFSDNAGTVAGTSVVLDSRGEPTTFKLIWLDSTKNYKFILKDSTGTTIWTIDNIPAGVNAADVNYTPAGSGAVTRSVQTKLRETVSVKDFGAVGDGTTDDTAAIQAAINAAGTTREVHFEAGVYLINGTLTLTDSHVLIGAPTVQFFDLRYVTNYPGTKLIQGTASNDVIRITVSTTANKSLVSHIRDIAIQGSFVTGGAAGAHGISLVGDTTATMNNAQLLWERVSVTRTAGRGISLYGPCYGSRLSELWAYNCGLAGIYVSAPSPGDATSEVLADGWHAFNNGTAATATNADRCGIFCNARGSSWAGIRWSGTGNKGFGIWVTGSSGFDLIAPTAESNDGLVTGATAAQIYLGSYVAGGVLDGITGCVVTAPTVSLGASNSYGLVISDSANFSSVIGYRGFDSTTADDIYISSNADFTTLVNCRLVEGLTDLSATTARINCYVGAAAQNRMSNIPTSFFGGTPIAKPTVTGAKGGNAALTSLLTQLAALGLITDSTT